MALIAFDEPACCAIALSGHAPTISAAAPIAIAVRIDIEQFL